MFYLVFCCGMSVAQEAAYFALQRPGQGNLAIDKAKKVAYITDLGKSGDGDRVTIDGVPLIDSLVAQGVETLVFTCSHPHSDHSGGIRALFEAPEVFFNDAARKVPRFSSIVVVENGVKESLFTILSDKLGSSSALKLTRVDATSKNAFAGYSKPSDDVYIENIPYEPNQKAGPHGRSIVTHFVLGQEYSNVDFDDADSAVVLQTVNAMKAKGVKSIDSFVVPHHGSAYHDIEPILSLSPKKAIITVNPRNPYGHPSPSILIALMDKIGAENVIFTGSIDHVVLGPEGVKHARYTANQEESFNLFIKPSYDREKAKANPISLALYRQLESRMTDRTTLAQSDIQHDELEVHLEAAQGANDDLLGIADRLALSTTLSPKAKEQFNSSVRNQVIRLKTLQDYIEKNAQSATTDTIEARNRIERMLRQIQPDITTLAENVVSNPNSDDGSLGALSQAVALGIQELFSSAPESTWATRKVTEARYVASNESVLMGEPEVSKWTGKPVKISSQKTSTYSHMESSPVIEDRPGGIALGNTAELDSGGALDNYVLRFDPKVQTLVLSGPNHAEIYLDRKISLSTLKALYRFAASERSAAVASDAAEGNDRLETIRLDPAFVDTQVGNDLIATDQIGGELYYSGYFKGFGYLNTFSPDDSFNEGLHAAMKTYHPCLGLATGALTWFDNPTHIQSFEKQFSLSGGIRLEFIIVAKDPDQASCEGMQCVPSPSTKGSASGIQYCHLKTLEQFVDGHMTELAGRFPYVEHVGDYAKIVSFLRWARRPGHLAGINLAVLADVPAGDANNRTPDLINR